MFFHRETIIIVSRETPLLHLLLCFTWNT